MNPYFEQAILSADPIELTAMVYQCAIARVREAREHLRNGRIAERSASIMRAYGALAELLSALRAESAPEFATRLHALYVYLQQRLLVANMQQTDAPLEEVLGLLSTLAESWATVEVQMRNTEPEPFPVAVHAESGRMAIHA